MVESRAITFEELQKCKDNCKVEQTDMANELKELRKDFTNFKEKQFHDLELAIANLPQELAKQFDNKYSSKWVETFLLWAGAIIGVIVLTGLASLTYKASVYFFNQ